MREPSEPSVTLVVRKLKGGSQSRLVLCDDGKLYVLKMHPNPQGPCVLANEALGSMLLSSLGFSVPRWRPITINLNIAYLAFPELTMETANGTHARRHAAFTLALSISGVRRYDLFRPHTGRLTESEMVNSSLRYVYSISGQAITTTANACIVAHKADERLYEALFIDNGHLFGGPCWSHECHRSVRLWSHFIEQHRPTDSSIMESLTRFETRIPRLLDDAVAAVPPEWYKGDIHALYTSLLERLACLRATVTAVLARTGGWPRLNGARGNRVW